MTRNNLRDDAARAVAESASFSGFSESLTASAMPSDGGQRRLRLEQTFAHHELGVLNRIERGAFPEVVAADPEREAVVERGVEADAADAALHLFAEIER